MAAPMQLAQAPIPVDDHVFLLGRPPMGEFLGFIRAMAVDGQNADQGLLANEWRQGNDRVLQLEKTEAGFADNPPIAPPPPALQALAQRVLNDPVFKKAYRFVPTEIAVIELDRLVVFQKFINLGFVEALKQSLPRNPSEEDVAQLALGLDRPLPVARLMQTAGNIYSFISPSNDFRFLEGAIVEPKQVTGFTSTGRPVACIVLAVGFGSNYLNAIHVEGRLVLNNGSHRAYALRELGIARVPALIQRVSRRDELEVVCGGDLQQNPDRYLKAPRPPLLKDYFDQSLRKVVPVPRKNRFVRVQFGAEQSDVPVT